MPLISIITFLKIYWINLLLRIIKNYFDGPIIFPIEKNKKNRPNLKSSIWRLFFISIDEEVKRRK